MSMSRYGNSAGRTRSFVSFAPIARIVAMCFVAFAHGVFSDSYAQGGADAPEPDQEYGSCRQDQASSPLAIAPPPAEGALDLSALDAYRTPMGVYRPLGDECSRGAELERLVCKEGAEDCIEDHGTYVRDEFLFAEPIPDPKTGETHTVRIISDGSLDILAKRDTSNPLRFAFYIAGRAIPGEIQIGDDLCLGHAECFVVRNVPNGFGLKNGAAYAQTKPLQAEFNVQKWADAFAAATANIYKAWVCYDVRNLNEGNFHTASGPKDGLCKSDKGWFKTPLGDAKTFEWINADHKLAIPFGLRYVSRNEQWGGERTDMFETETEINDNRSKTLGIKTGLNILGIINTEVHNNTTATAKRQNLSSKDVTYSKFEQTDVDFALVLDRYNVPLTDDFRDKVASMAKVFVRDRQAAKTDAMARQRIDDQYAAFIEQVGTHVPYATTYGRRAFQLLTYTKEAVQTLAEDGVSVSTGASVGVSMPVPELGGDVGANFGVDSGSAKDHAIRLKQVLGKNWSKYECIGGSNCHGSNNSGEKPQPLYLDLMPVSELLGPPFFLFSYPRYVGPREAEQFKNFTTDDMLGLRDDLRDYIKRVAFLTDPKDMPSNIVKNEYVRLSRVKLTGCSIVTTTFGEKDGQPAIIESSIPYDGGIENCRVSDLKLFKENEEKKTFTVSATRAMVFPRYIWPEGTPPQDNLQLLAAAGKLSVKPTAACGGGSGFDDMEEVGTNYFTVPLLDGKRSVKFHVTGILDAKQSATKRGGRGGSSPRPGVPGVTAQPCTIRAWFEADVEVGGAALMLDAD